MNHPKPAFLFIRFALYGLLTGCVWLSSLIPVLAIELDDIMNGSKPGTGLSPSAHSTHLGSKPVAMPSTFNTELVKPEDMRYTSNVFLVDFKSAIQLALRQSLTLASMKSKSNESFYAKREALSELLPDISLGYRQSRFQGGIQVFDGNPNLAYITTILPEIKATLPINLAGAQIFNINSRDKQLLVAQHLEELVTDETLYYIASDYLNLLTQHLNLQAAHQNLEEDKAQLTFAKARYEEGLGVLLEVLEAQNKVDAQTRRVLDTKQEILAANQRLNAHFGFPHQTTLIPVMESVTALKLYDAEYLRVEDIIQQAMASSPRSKQAFYKREAAQQAFRSTVASLFPTLTLSGYLNQVGNDWDNLLESRYGGVEINLNILQGLGMTTHARVKQSQEVLKQANIDYEQQRRDIERDMAIEVNALKKTAQLLPVVKNQLLTAEEAKGQAWGRYQSGVSSYLELLQASSTLQNARTQYIAEQLDYRRQQLKLAFQLGELKQKLVAMGLPEMVNMPTHTGSTASSEALGKRPFKALSSRETQSYGASSPSHAGVATHSHAPQMPYRAPVSASRSDDLPPMPPPKTGAAMPSAMPQGSTPRMMPGHTSPMGANAMNTTYSSPTRNTSRGLDTSYSHTHPMAPGYIKPSNSTLMQKVPPGYAVPIEE
jgi:outer membrane protein TolC